MLEFVNRFTGKVYLGQHQLHEFFSKMSGKDMTWKPCYRRQLFANPSRLVTTFAACFSLLALFGAGDRASAQGYTPEHPTVQAMINKGLKFIETAPQEQFSTKVNDWSGKAGETILAGYAHYKCRHDAAHPVVKRGVDTALKMVNALRGGSGEHGHKKNYEMAVCVLLLGAVDGDRYKKELQDLQHFLFESQADHGGWPYPGSEPGDTSQTQYALLAVWTLDRMGIKMDYPKVVQAMQWLLQVQSVNGGWPYHGELPRGGQRINQKRVDMSMALAGGSSLLIAGDALRLWGQTGADDDDPGIVGLPKAIKLYREDKNKAGRRRATISEEPIKRAISSLEGYRKAHPNPIKRGSGADWYFYQLYTLERYESFIEIAQGKVKEKSPAWYNTGVSELKKFQNGDGSWADRQSRASPISDTSFGLLFLIRSTQKTVFSLGEGTLSGGYGLPDDTTEIRVEGTQIKGRPIAADLESMMSLLEKDGADNLSDKSLPENLVISNDPATRAAQLDRLERLVRGSKSWQARRVAARVLSTTDELRVVPSLIYALSDTDPMVWRYARDGLRFISRQFDGMGLDNPPRGKPVHSASTVASVQKKWRAWYKTMNPKYVFLDYDL